MAAPVLTARVTPTGNKQPDGFPTKITFASKPNVQLWEQTVKMPSVDGGEAIPTSTMHNAQWHTAAPRRLKKLDAVTFRAAYRPAAYSDIVNLVNVEDSITVALPEGTTIVFFGFLQKAEFDDYEEGKMPTVTCTVVPTNWDAANGVEAGPVVTPGAGPGAAPMEEQHG